MKNRELVSSVIEVLSRVLRKIARPKTQTQIELHAMERMNPSLRGQIRVQRDR
jgi:hypothetical protein